VRRIEGEIALVRDDLGRTVTELGTRLTPAHLLAHARETIKDATVEKTRAVAQSAGDIASDLADKTRSVAADATGQVRANPIGAAAAGIGLVLGIWAARRAAGLAQRAPDGRHRPVDATPRQLASAAAAMAAAWWVWKGGRL
jgi:hypothetical protein